MPATTENIQFCPSVLFSFQLSHTQRTHAATTVIFTKTGWMNQSRIYSQLSNNMKRIELVRKIGLPLLLLACLDCPEAAYLLFNKHKASLQS